MLNNSKTEKPCKFESGIESSVESGFVSFNHLGKKTILNNWGKKQNIINTKNQKTPKNDCKILILKKQLVKSAERWETKPEKKHADMSPKLSLRLDLCFTCVFCCFFLVSFLRLLLSFSFWLVFFFECVFSTSHIWLLFLFVCFYMFKTKKAVVFSWQ